MATFTDRHGDEWTLTVTVGDLPGLRAAGLDLDKPETIEAAVGNPEMLGRVLWSLCYDQAAGRAIDPAGFGLVLDGPALARAEDALGEALADFIYRRPALAEAAKRALRAAVETGTAERAARLAGSNDTVGNSPVSAG